MSLLESYKLEIFNNECMSSAMTVQCFAHLDQDVGEALPYLNACLGGIHFTEEPPIVTFQAHGKLITVSGRKIAINALKDKKEAKKIVEWMKREINYAWVHREQIEPKFDGIAKASVYDVLQLLPKTNCKECGAPTCMVFAVQVTEGAKDDTNCPYMTDEDRAHLIARLGH